MRQALTAVQVYRQDIEPTLKRRQAFVRSQLVRFLDQFHFAPTSAELLRFIQATCIGRFDCNSVRPRLTELEAIRWVRHGVRRRCDVTSKIALTWLPSSPQAPEQQPLAFEAHT